MANVKMSDISIGRVDAHKIDPRLLKVDPGFNLRTDSPESREADIELKASLKANGAIEPFKVRLLDGDVLIVNGHRRHKQIMELISEGEEFATVMCIQEPKGTTDLDRDVMLITTNQGLPMSPIDKGTLFKRMLSKGMSREDIGARIGYSSKHIDNYLSLAGASVGIKEMIAEGTISATTAIKAIKAEGNTKATETLSAAIVKVKAEGGTKVTDKHLNPKPKATAPIAPPTGGLASLLNITPSQTPIELAPAMVFDENGNRFPRIMNTPQSFKELQETMREILNLTDISTIHIMIRDALKVERKEEDKAA